MCNVCISAVCPLELNSSSLCLPHGQTTAAFLFPLHFFFSFLYYTDVPSLAFTLACHLAATRRSYKAAGALGLVLGSVFD